jgi:phosphate transport system permease protein
MALPVMRDYGLDFITSRDWSVSKKEFGVLPQIWGTLYSSVLALILGSIFGLAVAIFLSEDFLPPRYESLLKHLVELLAAIPSVIYGLWGIYVVIPALRDVLAWSHRVLGTPAWDVKQSMLPAALVLAIMVLPTISALSRAALKAVPQKLRDGAAGLGATRWETILRIVLPTAATGIAGSIILAFGRAVGETMALAMLAGGVNRISWSLLSPADTLAALLANKFPEAGDLEVGALMYASLILLAITLVVNIIGAAIIWRASASLKGLN